MIRALISAALLAGPAHAQGMIDFGGNAPATVPQVWQTFEDACTQAVSDPAGFVASHPATGTGGAPRIVSSPDGLVVVLSSDPSDPVFRQIEFLTVPGALQVICQVHGAMTMSVEEMMTMSGAAVAARAAETESALRAQIAARPDSSITGGAMPSRPGPGDMMMDAAGFDLAEHIFGIQTPLAGEKRFVYASIVGPALTLVAPVSLPPTDLGVRQAAQQSAGTSTPAPAPAPTANPAFAEAVRANLALGIELCLRHMPQVDQALAAFTQAGFAYTPESLGGGDVIHWFAAPADTMSVGVVAGQMAPECRVTSTHMGVTEAVAFTGAVLQQRFPALNFQYGTMENTPPVTATNMGNRWEFCTGYIGWNGQRPVTLSVANDGNDPACIEDGSVQIVVTK